MDKMYDSVIVFLNSAIIISIVNIISLVSIVMVVITYIKVVRVKNGINNFKHLIDLSNITDILETNLQVLNDISIKELNNNVVFHEKLLNDIPKALGVIEGVSKMMDGKQNKKKSIGSCPVNYYCSGYYSTNFILEKCRSAKTVIRIAAKRNQRLLDMNLLQVMSDKLINSKKINIEMLALSPNTHESILEEIIKTIPLKPKDVTDMREQLQNNQKDYNSLKSKLEDSQKERFKYYEYEGYIPFHFVQIDTKLYFGLVNCFKNADDFDILEKRPYLEYDIKDEFAGGIIKQFTELTKICDSI